MQQDSLMSTRLLNMAPAGDRGSCQTSDFPFSPPDRHLLSISQLFPTVSIFSQIEQEGRIKKQLEGNGVVGVWGVLSKRGRVPLDVFGGSVVPQLSEFCRLWVPSRYV